MTPSLKPVIAFDPGASTGVGVLDAEGEILFTATLSLQELDGFLKFINWMQVENTGFHLHVNVVVEQGPGYNHHSPVTLRAEASILDVFPNATRVKPSQWKSHPVYSKRVHIPRRLVTTHEHDAIRLAQWFQGEKQNEAKKTHTVGTDGKSRRRKHK